MYPSGSTPAWLARPGSWRGDGGFTLTEVLIVVSVILLLVGLLIPAVGMVRDQVRRAGALVTVTGLASAVELYRDEAKPQRYPLANAESSIQSRIGAGGPLPLDLLRDYSFAWRAEQLDGSGRLCDPWRRYIRYRTDETVSDPPVPDRPAPVDDWNPQGREPFAYIWSLGRPSGDGIADADPGSAGRWIYRRSAP